MIEHFTELLASARVRDRAGAPDDVAPRDARVVTWRVCVCVCSPRTRFVAPQISRGAGTDGDDGYATRLHTANLIQGAEALLEQISALKLSLVLGDLDAIDEEVERNLDALAEQQS